MANRIISSGSDRRLCRPKETSHDMVRTRTRNSARGNTAVRRRRSATAGLGNRGPVAGRTRKHRTGLFSAGFWSDQLVAWAMKDPAFGTQLFRFIDVFPMLRTSEQVHDYLLDYLSQPGITLPLGLGVGLKASGLAKGLVGQDGRRANSPAWPATLSPAPTPPPPRPCSAALWKQGVAFSVDLLGEACVSEAEAEVCRRRYLDLLGGPACRGRPLAGRAAVGERSSRTRCRGRASPSRSAP